MKRIDFTIINGVYSYPVDMDFVFNVAYSLDSAFCIGDTDLDLPEASELDIAKTHTLDEYKAIKSAEMLTIYNQTISQITDHYPQSEMDTWRKQEVEARLYDADNQAVVPFLTTQAAARGITTSELATIIITKADQYSLLSASALGTRQNKDNLIELATTHEELIAIT